jgi:hypothetical protein
MKRTLLTITTLLLFLAGNGQTHFVPVWTGNGLDHHNIYVNRATIDGVILQEGDEVGVFDSIYCVGAAIRPKILGDYLEIRCSSDDPTTPEIDGFRVGKLQYFRIYSKVQNKEYEFPLVEVTYGPPTFDKGGTTNVNLSVITNKSPVAEAGPNLVVDENELVTIDGSQSSDPNGNVLTYSWTIKPAIDGYTPPSLAKIIVQAPEVNINTTYTFTLVVADPDGLTSTDSMTLLVKNVNKVPEITGQTSITTDEDTPITLNIGMVNFIDPDPGQTHTLKVFPANNYTLNGLTITPAANFHGVLQVPVIINDGVGNSKTYTLTIIVNPVNDPPYFTTTPPTTVLQGKYYIYQVEARDVDGDNLTLTCTNLSWLNFTPDGKTAVLIGTPTASDVGNHNITISLTDGVITTPVTQSFTISVRSITNAPELLTTELKPANIGSQYVQDIEFFDSDFDSLFVRIDHTLNWLTIDETYGNLVNGVLKIKMTGTDTTVRIKGTPPEGSLGVFPVNIQFTDKTNTRSKLLPLKVLPVNTKPTAIDASIETNEDEEVLTVLSATDKETPSELTFTILQHPKYGELQTFSPRLHLYTPQQDYFGTDSILFIAKEKGENPLSDTGLVVITIKPVNDPPVLSLTQTVFTLKENESISVSGSVSVSDILDVDLAANSFTFSSYENFGPFSGSFNYSTLTYTPKPDFYGQDVVFLAAKEQITDGLTSEPVMLRFIVNRVNKSPFAAADTVLLFEDTPVTFIPILFDREDILSTLQIQPTQMPNHGAITYNGVVFTYTPEENWHGIDSISFKVMDSEGGLSDELKAYILCSSINDYPIAETDTIQAGGNAVVNIDFSQYIHDADNTMADLSVEFLLFNADTTEFYSVLASPLASTATPLTFTFTQNHVFNTDIIPYRVFDGTNTSAPAYLCIKGLPGIDPAAGSKGLDTLIARGDYIDLTYGDSTDLVFTVIYPGTATLDRIPELEITNRDSLNGILGEITPLFFVKGNPLISYKARYYAPTKDKFEQETKARGNATAVAFDKVGFKTRKGQKGDESNVDTLYIGNLGRKVPPIIAPIKNVTVNEGQNAIADVYYTDPDSPYDKITFKAESEVPGMTHGFTQVANEEGHLKLTVGTPEGFNGEMVISVSAKDDTTRTYRQFILTVNRVNQAPTIAMVDSLYYMQNTQRVLSTLIADRETATSNLTIHVKANPENAVESILRSDGDLTVLPAAGFNQPFYVVVSANDGQYTVKDSVKMLYKATNASPILEPISSIKVLEDHSVSINVTPIDPDANDPLTVSAQTDNSAIAEVGNITPVTATSNQSRSIALDPKPNAFGNANITIFVTDGFKQAAQEFSVEVIPVNDPPVLTPITDQTMDNDQTLTLALSATDVDSYIFTFGATSTQEKLNISVDGNTLTITVKDKWSGSATLHVTVQDDSTATAYQDVNLTVNDVSSAPTLKTDYLSVYPNPSSDRVYINWKEEYAPNSLVKIFNTQGQLVLERTLNLSPMDKNSGFSIRELNEGLYIIRVQTPRCIYTSRIIKH